MANTKEYKIVVNGVQESIDAVKSLNDQLKSLEDRIKALESKSIGVKATFSTGGGSKSSSTGSLSEEEKLERQINQLEEKRVAYSKEIYQNYLAAKDVLSETVKDQKSIAATERLQANAYSNTIQGMKQELADIKSAMQTVDLGDTDQMDKMVQRAKQLTDELKKIDEAYGQFGRNVGNYQSALDGLDKYKITIGGVTREFDNAKQAAKILSNELLNLPKGAKGADELHEALLKIRSDIADLQKSSSVMDNMLDTMESFTAIANVGQGIRALFGVDDAEMQKSIQNLVALQNILKGIETINKQLKTGEGIGGWIKPFTTQIDGAIAKLDALQTTMKATTVTSKAMVVGLKAATYALKAFKAALSLGISIAIDLVIEGVLELIETLKEGNKELENTKKIQEESAKAYADASAKISGYMARLKSFNGTKAEEKKLVNEINKDMGTSIGQYKTVDELQKALTLKGQAYAKVMMLQAKAQALLNAYTENYVKLLAAQKNAAAGGDKWKEWLPWNWGGKSAQEKADEEVTQIKTDGDKILKEYNGVMQEIDKVSKDFKLFGFSDQIEKNGNKTKDAVKKVEAELAKARIAAMKEGLNKTILQLEEERKERLAKLDRNAKDYKRQEEEINAFYNDRILDESEKWSRKMNKVYSDLYSTISSYATNNLKMVATETKEELDRALKGADDAMAKNAHKMAGYGLFGRISPKSQTSLGIMSISEFKNDYLLNNAKQYIDLEREAITLQAEYELEYKRFQEIKESLAERELESFEKYLERRKQDYEKLFDEAKAAKEELGGVVFSNGVPSIPGDELIDALYDEGYAKEISDIFAERMAIQKKYWSDVERITKEGAEKEKKARLDVMYKEQQEEDAANLSWRDKTLKDTNNYYKELKEGYEAQLENGLISQDEFQEKYSEAVERQEEDIQSIYEEYDKRINNIKAKYETERLNIIKDSSDKVKKVAVDELNQRMTEMRDFQTQIHNMEQKQPVVNAWGFTNWKETKKNYQEIKDSYRSLGIELVAVRNKAIHILGDKKASKELKDQAEGILREARNMAAGIGEALDEAEQKISDWAVIQTFAQEIQTYLQEVMNSFNTIMQAVWNAEDIAFEKQQDELDKWNEELDKKLDEQQEIVEKHKDAIDSIEDELATARGSRRQHLIDQINAEMEAQREARRQEQKIQKEKEKAEKKQKDLDKQRREEEYKRNMLQAIVNGAMAVTYAAMNNWPVPAIPMMALAAATTAAQVAIMAANKPYRVGGQLEGGLVHGKRHSQGGVPVGNTGIEVEGDEMIIRRESTMPNIDLLNYINKSQRKLSLDDFVDFYSSGKLKKNISSISPKRVFADGGVLNIPTISNDIDINDRLISAMEAYAERPVVVSVVDINNRQNAVKNVQVLAGITQE